MKLKGLTQSKGERDVRTILEDRLAKTPFQVHMKVQLNSVIGMEPQEERLPDELFDYLTRAELDFLISHRKPPCYPFLAVEFDGPHHEAYGKAQKGDILKNYLCRQAGLPLLRVRYQEIEPLFTRDSLLSYLLIEIILHYKKVHERKEYLPPQYPDAFTEKDYDEIRRHDLSEVQSLKKQLAKQHSLIPLDQATQGVVSVK